jgi:peroxiredoxin
MKQMMKFLLAGVAVLCFGCTRKNTIDIPVFIQNGYGPFSRMMGGIAPDWEDENNPWRKTYLQVSGIPDDWTDAKKGDICINMYQMTYQNYLLGKISRERYEELQKSWGWIPDTLSLSKTPLKCQIAFAFGKDAAGETKMVVDANNNLDFSDDAIFTPLSVKGGVSDSLMLNNLIPVTYERLSNDRIVQEQTALFIVYRQAYNMWMSNFSQHIGAKFKGKEFAISGRFMDLSYDRTELLLMDDSLKGSKKASMDKVITENEYLMLDGKVYLYKGVNMNRNVMMLEEMNLPKNQLYSTQIGFKAIPFEGNDFKSKNSISLDKYKGKYLLIDFWAVWCGPCIQELPHLKTMYEKLDTSKIDIIGFVGDSPPDALEKTIDQYGITWMQILADETNGIKQKYKTYGYPATFLIDPEGIIIAKNLRGKELENKINKLIAE